MKKSITWVIVAVVLVLIVVGTYFAFRPVSESSNPPSGTVLIQNFSFSPQTITIKKGDTVTWKNDDSAVHRVVANDNSFELGDMVSGASVKRTFTSSGTFNYHCSVHSYMAGKVVVE
jgi:plastocyanin